MADKYAVVTDPYHLRQLAYIDGQLARGDREPADENLLTKRKAAILREAKRTVR